MVIQQTYLIIAGSLIITGMVNYKSYQAWKKITSPRDHREVKVMIVQQILLNLSIFSLGCWIGRHHLINEKIDLLNQL